MNYMGTNKSGKGCVMPVLLKICCIATLLFFSQLTSVRGQAMPEGEALIDYLLDNRWEVHVGGGEYSEVSFLNSSNYNAFVSERYRVGGYSIYARISDQEYYHFNELDQLYLEFQDNQMSVIEKYRNLNGFILKFYRKDSAIYDNPFLGFWGSKNGSANMEIKGVKGEGFPLVVCIPKIYNYAGAEGCYLLKLSGNSTLVSDDTYPDGRIQLKLRSADVLEILPLFEREDIETEITGELGPYSIMRVAE